MYVRGLFTKNWEEDDRGGTCSAAQDALDAEAVRLRARVLSGASSRRRQIEIRASFAVDQSAIPVYGRLWGDSLLRARYVVFVDQNVNRHRDGWTGCAQT